MNLNFYSSLRGIHGILLGFLYSFWNLLIILFSDCLFPILSYEYKSFEEIKQTEKNEEFWYVRELATVLQYAKWENFSKVISRAMLACKNSGYAVSDHFPEVRKMVDIKNGTKRK